MKKRILSVLLTLLTAFALLPAGALAAGSLSNFTKLNTYESGMFTDVPPGQWYADEVQLAYEYGLVNGKTASAFEPDSNLTIAEAVKMAAVLHSIFNTGASSLTNGDPWYQTYVDYALQNGILASPYVNYNANATRADFAVIFAAALPAEALTPINQIGDNSIPDVLVTYSYGPAVYLLYRAGVLTGNGDARVFNPNDSIRRSEVAAIAARMVSTGSRVSFSMSAKELTLTATELAAKCSPAVFYIEVYNSKGVMKGSGSGFFISSSGLAVTNFHVIEGASSAKIVMKSGKVCSVAGVYDYSMTKDLALLQIEGGGFSYLEIGDSETVKTGDQIYAIGYPGGIDQTVSQGVITNDSHYFEDLDCFLTDAAITPGSSGGPIVNSNGQVVGVSQATYIYAENMNVVLPAGLIGGLSGTVYKTMTSVVEETRPTLEVSQGNVSMYVGAEATVTFTLSSLVYDKIMYSINADDIVSCQWSGAGEKIITGTLTGLKAGSTILTVSLLDEDNKAFAEETVLIRVKNVGYYPGTTVPNFAITASVIPYDEYTVNGALFFIYKAADLAVSVEEAIDTYLDFLEEVGFTYKGTTTQDGATYYIESNDTNMVSIGAAKEGSETYIYVTVY